MNLNQNNNKLVQPPQTVAVRFEFTHPTATSIGIAGTFSNWKPIAKPVKSSGGGRWWMDMALTPGSYELLPDR
jgi:hypothetical protein